VGHDVVEVGDLAHERVGLRVARPGLLEVRADPAAQRGGLAYVERLALGVAVEVDPRAIGQCGELLVQRHDLNIVLGASVLARRRPGTEVPLFRTARYLRRAPQRSVSVRPTPSSAGV